MDEQHKVPAPVPVRDIDVLLGYASGSKSEAVSKAVGRVSAWLNARSETVESDGVCKQCDGKGTVVFRDTKEEFDMTCGVCEGNGKAPAMLTDHLFGMFLRGIPKRLSDDAYDRAMLRKACEWLIEEVYPAQVQEEKASVGQTFEQWIDSVPEATWEQWGKREAAHAAWASSLHDGWKPLPEGWKLVRVNEHFDGLIAALERAESKGYLPDSLQEIWDNFACDENVGVQPARADEREPVGLAKALTDEQRNAIGYAARMLEKFSDGRATAAIRTLSAMLTESPVSKPAEAPIDPTDPGYDVETLREHIRHLERRVRQLSAPSPADERTLIKRLCVLRGSLRHDTAGWETVRDAIAALEARASESPTATIPKRSPGVWPTDAMNEAGLKALDEFHHTRSDAVDAVFLAMCAAASPAAEAPALADLTNGQAAIDAVDAKRFRWLTEDHADPETRERQRGILESMKTRSYAGVCLDIDANMNRAEHSVQSHGIAAPQSTQSSQMPIGKVLSDVEMFDAKMDAKYGNVIWFNWPKPGYIYGAPQPTAVTVTDEQIMQALESAGVTWQVQRSLASDMEVLTHGSTPAACIIAGIRMLLGAPQPSDKSEEHD